MFKRIREFVVREVYSKLGIKELVGMVVKGEGKRGVSGGVPGSGI